jgi:hypothetical protein
MRSGLPRRLVARWIPIDCSDTVAAVVRRLRTALLGLLASLLWAAPAGAFTAPALYLRLAHANSTDPTSASGWMPLSAAPRLNWLGGYEIGYAFEDAPGAGASQHAALQITGVPDGHPTQPLNTPYCSGGPGTVGAIVPIGTVIQFEGSGVYTATVSVGPPSGGPNSCIAGPGTASSSGSFTVDAPVAPTLFGRPLIFRAKPLAGSAFVGVRTLPPPGGDAETRCARNATLKPDGSVTGPLVAPPAALGSASAQIAETDFVRPGAWTCVARGFVGGLDDNFNDVIFGTPWSAPLHLDVRSDFRRSKQAISKPRSKNPLLRFTAEFPEAAGGGTSKLQLARPVRCAGTRLVFKAIGTFRGRFDARGLAIVKIRRPSAGLYVGILSFSGTRFYTKSVDPNPVLLQFSVNGKLAYVPPSVFPQCPGFR